MNWWVSLSRFGEYLLEKIRENNWVDIAEIGIGYNYSTLKHLINYGDENLSFVVVEKNEDSLSDLEGSMDYDKLGVVNTDISDRDFSLGQVDLIYSVRPNPELVKYLKKISKRLDAVLIIRPFSLDGYREDLELVNYRGLPILLYDDVI